LILPHPPTPPGLRPLKTAPQGVIFVGGMRSAGYAVRTEATRSLHGRPESEPRPLCSCAETALKTDMGRRPHECNPEATGYRRECKGLRCLSCLAGVNHKPPRDSSPRKGFCFLAGTGLQPGRFAPTGIPPSPFIWSK
jgi:hypothetical protein